MTDVMKFDVPRSGAMPLGLWVGLSNGSTFTVQKWATWITTDQMKVLVGDFDGDGKDDVMKFDVSAGTTGTQNLGLWVGLSSGNSFLTSKFATWSTYRDMKVLAGDFNGDGKTDVMKFDVPHGSQSSNGLWVGTSTGSSFKTHKADQWITDRYLQVHAADFNNDGKTDVLGVDCRD